MTKRKWIVRYVLFVAALLFVWFHPLGVKVGLICALIGLELHDVAYFLKKREGGAR